VRTVPCVQSLTRPRRSKSVDTLVYFLEVFLQQHQCRIVCAMANNQTVLSLDMRARSTVAVAGRSSKAIVFCASRDFCFAGSPVHWLGFLLPCMVLGLSRTGYPCICGRSVRIRRIIHGVMIGKSYDILDRQLRDRRVRFDYFLRYPLCERRKILERNSEVRIMHCNP
jgi:hypothetical protein